MHNVRLTQVSRSIRSAELLERRAIYRNQFCFSSGVLVQKESDAVRSGATDKSLDVLVGRRLETRRAGRIC
ncbi:MAG: hypothetical protein KDJ45_15485, partial [Hyphomicrobiaceae bacterium]|nr:hypothetical protein [Hyphomicrobiaceae bacterium]